MAEEESWTRGQLDSHYGRSVGGQAGAVWTWSTKTVAARPAATAHTELIVVASIVSKADINQKNELDSFPSSFYYRRTSFSNRTRATLDGDEGTEYACLGTADFVSIPRRLSN